MQRMATAATGTFKLEKGKSRESKKEKAKRKTETAYDSSFPSMDGMMPMSVASRFRKLIGRKPKDIKEKVEKEDFIRRFELETGNPYIKKEDSQNIFNDEDSEEEDSEDGRRVERVADPA